MDTTTRAPGPGQQMQAGGMGAPACQAVWDTPPASCGAPAAGLYRRACVHEHVRDGWLCERHADLSDLAICKACRDHDGHCCPLGLVRIGDVPAEEQS